MEEGREKKCTSRQALYIAGRVGASKFTTPKFLRLLPFAIPSTNLHTKSQNKHDLSFQIGQTTSLNKFIKYKP